MKDFIHVTVVSGGEQFQSLIRVSQIHSVSDVSKLPNRYNIPAGVNTAITSMTEGDNEPTYLVEHFNTMVHRIEEAQ